MDPREELIMLRRLAELEARQGRQTAPQPERGPDPAAVRGSLQIGPIDTGIGIPVGVTNALAGTAKAVVDGGRGLGQLVGAVSGEDVAASRKLDRPLMNTGAGTLGNIAGNIGMALTPGAALKAASAIPQLARAAPALAAAGSTLMAPRTIGAGLAVGGGMGLIQPATDMGERGLNVALGAGAGALVPAAQWAGRTAWSALEPFSQGGRTAIVGRALRDAAGKDPDGVAQALKTAPRQIIPGSELTVAQAAKSPSLAALERAASAVNPTVTNEYGARMAAQGAARATALDSIAGDAATVAAAKGARSAATNELYDQTGNVMVKMDGELESLLRRPSMASALNDARKLAADRGQRLSFDRPAGGAFAGVGAPREAETFLDGRSLHTLKMALDDASDAGTSVQKGIAANQLGAIRDNKTAYLKWLEARLPEYGQARQTYRQMSQPVNAMETAQAIRDKATNRVSGAMTPAAYMRALDDKTAQQATGMSNATLQGVFNPSQQVRLAQIGQDLQAANFAQTAGRGVGSDTVQKLAYSNMLNQAGVPTFLRNFVPGQVVGNVLAQGAQAGYSNANQKLAEQLALALLNPQEAARMMAQASPALRNKLGEALRLTATPTALGLPGMVNAQQ